MKCPKCNNEMQIAFCNKAEGLSCAMPEKFDNFIFLDKDLSGAGLKKFFPHKAEWHPAYLCQDCTIYVIEYGVSMNHKEAEKKAKKIIKTSN